MNELCSSMPKVEATREPHNNVVSRTRVTGEFVAFKSTSVQGFGASRFF